MDILYYFCSICGKLITVVKNSGTPTICCGEVMKLLKPNTEDGAFEKHVPVVKQEDDILTVYVGETPHPMTEEHFIEWILVQTNHGIFKKHLSPSDNPVAKFKMEKDETFLNAFAYCNIHKLWKYPVMKNER